MRIISTRSLYAYALENRAIGAVRLPNNHTICAQDGGYRFIDERGEEYRWERSLDMTLDLADRLLAEGCHYNDGFNYYLKEFIRERGDCDRGG